MRSRAAPRNRQYSPRNGTMRTSGPGAPGGAAGCAGAAPTPHPVAPEPGAGDDGGEPARPGLQGHLDPLARGPDPVDLLPEQDLPAALPDVVGEPPAHRREIDRRGVRGVQGGDADRPRLDLPQPDRVDEPQAGDAVALGPLADPAQRRELGVGGRHHHLAELVVPDGVLGAVVPQHRPAATAQRGFQGARLVVRDRHALRSCCAPTGGLRHATPCRPRSPVGRGGAGRARGQRPARGCRHR